MQYAIDCGDGVVAPKIRDHLRWAIRVGKRRPELKDSTLATYAAKAERRLDALLGVPAAHPDGRELQRQIKAWRGKPVHIETVDSLTNWLDDKIDPKLAGN